MAKSTRRPTPAKQKARYGTAAPPSAARRRPTALATGDVLAEKMAGTQDLASAFPFNPIKSAEYDPGGRAGAARGPVGQARRSDRRGEHGERVERLGEDRQRRPEHRPQPDGRSARSRPRRLDRPRADDQSGRAGRRQSELAQSRPARADAARRLHPPREDHPLRPRTHSRADRPRARIGGARLLRVHRRRCRSTPAPRCSPRSASRRRCSCASRRCSGERGSTDTARDVRGFAVKFYTDEGNWDLVGNNIPVFFIQDAMKFPDLVHAAKPEPHFAMPQAGVGARHVLGLRLADAGDHPHADVGDVRPGDSAQLPDHAGVRRAHLPPGQRQRRVALRQVSLDAARRHAFAGLGRGGQDFGRRLRLPSPRSLGSDRGGRLSRVRARAADLHRGTGRGVHLRRARRDEDRARGARAGRSRSASWC